MINLCEIQNRLAPCKAFTSIGIDDNLQFLIMYRYGATVLLCIQGGMDVTGGCIRRKGEGRVPKVQAIVMIQDFSKHIFLDTTKASNVYDRDHTFL